MHGRTFIPVMGTKSRFRSRLFVNGDATGGGKLTGRFWMWGHVVTASYFGARKMQ